MSLLDGGSRSTLETRDRFVSQTPKRLPSSRSGQLGLLLTSSSGLQGKDLATSGRLGLYPKDATHGGNIVGCIPFGVLLRRIRARGDTHVGTRATDIRLTYKRFITAGASSGWASFFSTFTAGVTVHFDDGSLQPLISLPRVSAVC
ncbi:uncharacterized protein BT62DRAFT_1006174 [Guyanagaster necrorhizus]|uniref:Uncharacterized protein n=1 Tax=Guyanagaster necrorhizus TaxID=856835 RepID=A0A9P8AS35_9AGAR|nr:uncharacterized protein BT62DRAFT_1006174 [Guyanagaster necrorhizus MCA 3950]KAG7445998.1 hypothetical protein BT62DRAFT_1006174 [Guyanagaster necrorhizus MCA 3950]